MKVRSEVRRALQLLNILQIPRSQLEAITLHHSLA